jgi:hypothetical protein
MNNVENQQVSLHVDVPKVQHEEELPLKKTASAMELPVKRNTLAPDG